MGEAKRKREALREAALIDMERFMLPPSDGEAALLAEIDALEVKLIPRAPEDALRYMRMVPQQCHVNASAYVKLDLEKKSHMVSGWWVRGDVYVFHSVIGRDGGYSCITPYGMGHEPTLEFVPDDAIVWRDGDDGLRHASRNGIEVPYAVRRDPKRTIAECEYVSARLRAGVHPYQAMDLSGFVWP